MAIEISKQLLNKIIDDNFKQNIKATLTQKAAGRCFLCGHQLNQDEYTIVADHDIPEADGGPTDYDNLNLVHQECNAFKNKNSTLKVKKFLPIRQFLQLNPTANFERVSEELLRIDKKVVYIEIENSSVKITDPDSTRTFGPYPIFSEKRQNSENPIKYIFARLPIRYLFNDTVQPRSIKEQHVFKLFQDLHWNPLHEPVGARLDFKVEDNIESITLWHNRILMFDGQHKTVAKALFKEEQSNFGDAEVDIKIYLNFTKEDAIHLVNSIQALVIKLGLTKSEFANKMGEELPERFENYEQQCRKFGVEPTETGFVKSAPAEDRRRWKDSLVQARLNQLITKDDQSKIPIWSLVESKDKNIRIKENTLFTKVLSRYLAAKPLDVVVDSADTQRSLERKNIQIVLDLMYNELYTVSATNKAETVHQLLTQSVLSYVVDLTKNYINWLYSNAYPETIFFRPDFETVVVDKLRSFYVQFRNHPIWKYSDNYQGIIKIERFYNQIKQNQSLTREAAEVCLHQQYCVKMSPFESGITPDCLS